MISYLRLLLRTLLLLLLCGVTASFVISNPQALSLTLYPLPYALELPLYALAAILLFGGFLFGALFASLRASARLFRMSRRLKQQEVSHAATQRQLHTIEIERDAISASRLPLVGITPPAAR